MGKLQVAARGRSFEVWQHRDMPCSRMSASLRRRWSVRCASQNVLTARSTMSPIWNRSECDHHVTLPGISCFAGFLRTMWSPFLGRTGWQALAAHLLDSTGNLGYVVGPYSLGDLAVLHVSGHVSGACTAQPKPPGYDERRGLRLDLHRVTINSGKPCIRRRQ